MLLVAVVAIFGMALGYALGFPLRYVEYEASSAISLDQASLAGTVDVQAALVAEEDLGPGWTAGDPALGAFGVLGAPVCGSEIETPTPLSAREAVVWADETNSARIISQALRVSRWSDAEQYVEDVADELEDCDTFFRTDAGQRIRVTSREIERDPPVTDHVGRRFQSPTGVQDWSMMAVGDVIIAIQYLAPTPSPDGFLGEVERSVLERVAPAEFATGGVDPDTRDGSGADTGVAPGAQDPGPEVTEAPPTTAVQAPSDTDTGAADETGGN
ncbi:MAG: hypothetical protein R2716_11205 [Microthrixaceae bacterium]